MELKQKIAAAIRDAIGESDQLAALNNVGEEFHGRKNKTMLYVDGAFDLDAVASAVLKIPDIKAALAYAPRGTVRNFVTKEGGTVHVPLPR